MVLGYQNLVIFALTDWRTPSERHRPIPKCHGRRCRECVSRRRERVGEDPSKECEIRAQRKLEPLGNSNRGEFYDRLRQKELRPQDSTV